MKHTHTLPRRVCLVPRTCVTLIILPIHLCVLLERLTLAFVFTTIHDDIRESIYFSHAVHTLIFAFTGYNVYNPTQRHQGEHLFQSCRLHAHICVYNRARRHQVTTFAQAGSTYGTDFVLQYQARDRSNNAARVVTRTVTIVDTTPPVLRRHGDAVFRLEAGDPCVPT
jgi:hypothetical protein